MRAAAMTDFVNIHGQPIDMRAPAYAERMKEARRRGALGAGRKPTVKNGYMAPPGTGPAGEACSTCRFKQTMSNGGKKRFIKCAANKAKWTHGEGSDILARSPACRAWLAPEAAP